MDNAINEAQGGTHFWLRYAQQFTVGARTHTIEMSFPVPIGATPEECARLLQEADARFKQVETHVERRVTQMQHRSAPQPGAPASTPTSRPATQPASRPPAQPAAAPSSPTAHILSRDPREAADVAASPATSSAPPRTPQVQEAASRQETASPRPPARLNLPSTPGPMRNEGSNLKVAEFLNIVRDNYKLDPREVMGLLNVKSLSTINLNDALEDLRHIIEQNNHATPPANQTPGNRPASRPDEKAAPASRPENITSAQTAPVPAVQAPSAPAPTHQVANGNNRAATPAREAQAGYGFDEEEDDDLDFEEEDAGPQEQGREMTAQEEARGRQLISDLRGVRGNKPASESRLNVLMNIVSSQIDEDDLQRLVRGLWGVSYLKQLKVDQVEKLISWGKEDDFEDDVQLVLALL
ncbi:MAG: hypothetical protein ABI456_03570 [Ktedonobacteraceae bacterium]